MKIILRVILITIFLSSFADGIAQDPERFRTEVEVLFKRYSSISSHEDLIVFTGSSSVRLWNDLSDHFPGKNIINTGFGGSHMSDLLFYLDELIIRYKPVQVFIYEGDNDISSGKSPDEITQQAVTLCKLVSEKLPKTEIVFISPKPSPLRWNLRDNYISLNTRLSALELQSDLISYADVWTRMIKNGRPDGSLFTADSLHMNGKGYRLWAEILRKQVR